MCSLQDNGEALRQAATDGNLQRVRRLLRARSAAPDAADAEDGWTPLMLAAYFSHASVVEELLRYGANANAAAPGGLTALQAAAEQGGAEAVSALLRHGAAVDQTSHEGWTPLHYACANRHLAAVQQLLAAGADPVAARAISDAGATALHSQLDFAGASGASTPLCVAATRTLQPSCSLSPA